MLTDKEEILEAIAQLAQQVKDQGERLTKVETKLSHLETKLDRDMEKFAIYRDANQSLVNLAFGLIASATIVTVAGALFRR